MADSRGTLEDDRKRFEALMPKRVVDVAPGRTLTSPATAEDLIWGLTTSSPGERIKAAQTLQSLSHERTALCSRRGLVEAAVAVVSDAAVELTSRWVCCWALANVAGGDRPHARAVVESGGLTAFVSAASSSDEQLAQSGIWGIGNVAAEFQQETLASGALEAVVARVGWSKCKATLFSSAWALANLVGRSPASGGAEVAVASVVPAVGALAYMLSVPDRDVALQAAWGMAEFVSAESGKDARIAAVVRSYCMRALSLLLRDEIVCRPVLLILGNVALGSPLEVSAIVEAQILPALAELLTSRSEWVRKHAAWVLENLLCGPADNVNAVARTRAFTQLTEMAFNPDECRSVRVCCVRALSNAALSSPALPPDLAQLVLPALVAACESPPSPEVLSSVVPALHAVYRADSKGTARPLLDHWKAAHTLRRVARRADDRRIAERASRILHEFYKADESNEVEDVTARMGTL
eukprot:m51a1_g8595 hypothetical protein (468) ;mRNA; r:137707-139547